MGQSSSVNEKTVMHKFGRYCKLVLCAVKLSYEKEMNQRKNKEKFISCLMKKRSRTVRTIFGDYSHKSIKYCIIGL